VISYIYEFPSVRHFNSLSWMPSRLTDGWEISGITTFQNGFPLDVVDGAEPSLTASYYTFYSLCPPCAGWDVPNRVGSTQYVNPRTSLGPALPGSYLFNPNQSGFAGPTLGTEGNAGRNILRGPGINNFDMALLKDIKITESTRIQLRFEFFNIFNHTQFDPIGATTDINSPAFGTELAARDPRIAELAAKFYF
jgi:hypothetical protein